MPQVRRRVLVLGDQLDLEAAAFDGFDAKQDAVWMAEAQEESTHVGSSKQRIALFLSAMRHFAQALGDAGRTLEVCEDRHFSPRCATSPTMPRGGNACRIGYRPESPTQHRS